MNIDEETGIWLIRIGLLLGCITTAFIPENGIEISGTFASALVISFFIL